MCAIVLLFALLAIANSQDSTDILVEANTRFALDTYQQLGTNNDNIFFSPLSLSVILGMLYEGSDGNTRSQMESVANFDQVKHLASSFRELSSVLNTPNKNYTLRAANRVYASSDYSFLPDYMQTIRDDYQSDVVSSDFIGNADAVRSEINDWVEEKTMDKIQDLIPPNVLQPNTQMVLVNALYFKGDWEKKFNSEKTTTQKFSLSVKESVSTDMMYQKGKFRLMRNSRKGYQALELPYKGEDLSMFIILPDAVDGLASVEKLMTYDEMQSVHSKLSNSLEVDVLLTLPKFKIEQKYTMNNYFSKMGMDDLFSEGVCDLSGMDGTRLLYVSKMFHQSFIDVNEEGSEAAAATGAVVNSRGFFPPTVFKADHPFIFYIKDNRSDSVLFMGRYVKP